VVAAYVAAARHQVEATTEVASLVVLAAGVAAGLGAWELAGGTIAVTTLLSSRSPESTTIARKLDDTSIRAAVRFGVMAIVILLFFPRVRLAPAPVFVPALCG
jgi:uncharacterized membrane protein (DUF4010 family)